MEAEWSGGWAAGRGEAFKTRKRRGGEREPAVKPFCCVRVAWVRVQGAAR